MHEHDQSRKLTSSAGVMLSGGEFKISGVDEFGQGDYSSTKVMRKEQNEDLLFSRRGHMQYISCVPNYRNRRSFVS